MSLPRRVRTTAQKSQTAPSGAGPLIATLACNDKSRASGMTPDAELCPVVDPCDPVADLRLGQVDHPVALGKIRDNLAEREPVVLASRERQ